MNKDSKRELIKEAIEEYRKEDAKVKKHKVYHNTRLLMKHYNGLKQHSENAIYKAEQIFRDNDIIVIDDNDGKDEHLYIGSILKSKIRTAIMIQHIDMALDTLKMNAETKGHAEKFDTLIKFYISNITCEEMAEQYKCDVSTIHRWKNDALRELSILLFGEEGLILLA